MWRLKRSFWFYYKRTFIAFATYYVMIIFSAIVASGISAGIYGILYGILPVAGISALIAIGIYLFGMIAYTLRNSPIRLILNGILIYAILMYLNYITLYGSITFWNTLGFRQDYIESGFNWVDESIYMILFLIWCYYLYLIIKNESTKKDVAS